ncbi:MAG: hypothetical protein HYZ28_09465 [Myxococcales bacterium]|nr:hypothetical protein [Myxococcales bacterium]
MRAALGATALLLCACAEEFKPETVVENLRVLGVRASPAALGPGQSARLEALVVDPSRSGRSTVLWLACDPDPLNLGRSYCSDMATLSEPSALLKTDAGVPELPKGMRFIGLNRQASYRAPDDLFAQLPVGDARRRHGAVAQVLAIAVAEEVSLSAGPAELEALFQKVRSKAVRSVIALFRIVVSEDPRPNQNPELAGLAVAGASLPDGAHLRVRELEEVELELLAPDSAFEEYEQANPDGPEPKTERLIAAWYSTAGRFSEARVALRSDTKELYTSAGKRGDPVPEGREGVLYAVVRDTRGGQSWEEYPLYVCDPGLPPPAVESASPPSGRGDGSAVLALRGAQLSSTLDVMVGERALLNLSCSAASGECSGHVPPLPPGNYPLAVRGKHCADVETGLAFQVIE